MGGILLRFLLFGLLAAGGCVSSNRASHQSSTSRLNGSPKEYMVMNDEESNVWRTVQALNRAWTSGRVDELDQYFHQKMIAITPYEREVLDGRTACIGSWKRFVDAAKIHSWKEVHHKVRIYGDAAAVSYHYEISFDMRGKTFHEAGRDMFFLVKQAGKWWVVADQFSGYPKD